jgi:ribosomal protein L11 methyltransferase
MEDQQLAPVTAEVEILCERCLEDRIVSVLWEEGTTGVQVIERGGRPHSGTKPGIRLKAYFPAGRELSALFSRLKRIQQDAGAFITFRDRKKLVRNRNWQALVEASSEPIRVGRLFRVRPPWKGARKTHKQSGGPGRIEIVILPGMAFGTGRHESTALSLKLLERFPPRGQRGLDLGCGSGILAIASLMMGCREMTAVDTDPDAAEAAKKNAEANGVDASIRLVCGETAALAGSRFDFVVANLTAPIHCRLKEEYRRLLLPGGEGLLILSGILKTEKEAVRRELGTVGFRVICTISAAEWAALALLREDGHAEDKKILYR